MKKEKPEVGNRETPMRRGTTLVLSVLMLWMLLAIATGVATVLIGEIKISGTADASLVALYAADTGVECTLYQKRIPDPPITCNGTIGNNGLTLPASYVKVKDEQTPAGVVLQFSGQFRETNRGLEVRYQE